jgi:hypothetical protein
MVSRDDTDKPPTSNEEAYARRVRPPPEKYDPDKLSYWSITMTLAWIIWRDLNAVRNEWDDYRNECADWLYVADATAHTKLLVPELQEDLQKESPWHLCSLKPSGWNRLCLKAISENRSGQDAIDELWQAAGEDRCNATALKHKNAKAIVGDPIEIPAHYWPRLKLTDDRLTGKAILYDGQGRVYREVQFPRLNVKELWPKSPPLSGEQLEPGAVEVLPEPQKPERIEAPEPTRPAERKLLRPKAWLAKALKDHQQQETEGPTDYANRLYPLMQNAKETGEVTKVWAFTTLLRRLQDR